MSTRWQVRIGIGGWMCGTHTFKTQRAAQAFFDHWRALDASEHTEAALLRDGIVIDYVEKEPE
jgi:hypothetical protein